MVETKVPKDIRKFKGKAIGPFSFRQAICGLLAIVVDLVVYRYILKTMEVTLDTSMFIMILLAIVILAFSLEPHGMRMEVYLRNVVYKNFVFPTKRKVSTNLQSAIPKKTSEEIARINKEYKERIAREPEWKMYE